MGLGRARPGSRPRWRSRPARSPRAASLDEADGDPGPDRVRDRCRRLPGLAAGPPRRGDRAARRRSLRHRAGRCAGSRWYWTAARRSGAAHYTAAERGPARPGPDLVAARAQGRGGQVRDLVRAFHRLPRGRARPSPAGGCGQDGRRQALQVRQVLLRERARRGLGPVRRAAGRRAGLVRRAGHPARHAGRIGAACRPGGHRHRRPLGPAAARRVPVDVRPGLRGAGRARPRRAAAGARRGGRVTSVGRARPSPTSSASGAGWRPGSRPCGGRGSA